MESLERLLYHLSAYSGEYILGLAALLFLSSIAVLFLYVRTSALLKPLSRLKKDRGGEIELVASLAAAVEENRRALNELSSRLKELAEENEKDLKHVGLVRYDAFDGVGGRQSYSLCLLDGKRNGFLITFLTGKNFTRSYAVGIADGTYSRKLGEEELRAYEMAVSGATRPDS